jgi:hypothetical protein
VLDEKPNQRSGPLSAQAIDSLPSWNDGPAKQAIIEFVQANTDQASPKFLPPEARIDGRSGRHYYQLGPVG